MNLLKSISLALLCIFATGTVEASFFKLLAQKEVSGIYLGGPAVPTPFDTAFKQTLSPGGQCTFSALGADRTPFAIDPNTGGLVPGVGSSGECTWRVTDVDDGTVYIEKVIVEYALDPFNLLSAPTECLQGCLGVTLSRGAIRDGFFEENTVTYILDLDGTLLTPNGFPTFLPGAFSFTKFEIEDAEAEVEGGGSMLPSYPDGIPDAP